MQGKKKKKEKRQKKVARERAEAHSNWLWLSSRWFPAIDDKMKREALYMMDRGQ